MTLLATNMCYHGIVLASDSNLTDRSGQLDSMGPKTFPIPHLNAGVSIAGLYSVDGVCMDTWMPNFIELTQTTECNTLADFAQRLRDSFQAGMASGPPELMFAHIAGYATDRNGYHPEFHFVRNTLGMEENGEYLPPQPTFLPPSEDFYSRDCRHRNSPTGFINDGQLQFYTNGFPSGRITYVEATRHIGSFLQGVWGTPALCLRHPQTLTEVEGYVRLQMAVIHELFAMSGRTEIGGDIQTLAIAPPDSSQLSVLTLRRVRLET